MELLKQKGMNDVTVLLGGTIPEADIPPSRRRALRKYFFPARPRRISSILCGKLSLKKPRASLLNNFPVRVANLDRSQIEFRQFRLDLGAIANANQNHLVGMQIFFGDCFGIFGRDRGKPSGNFSK